MKNVEQIDFICKLAFGSDSLLIRNFGESHVFKKRERETEDRESDRERELTKK